MRASGLAILVTTLAAAGCGGGSFNPDDLNNPRLEFVSPQTQSLLHGSTSNLTVRYVEDDGTPIDSAPLTYEIVGVEAGSTLGATRAMTGSDGQATNTITTGTTNTSFEVRVTPPVGDPISFQIGVSETDAGSIVVTLTYTGSMTFDPFEAYLFSGQPCSGLMPAMLPTALIAASPVHRLSERPGFAPVEVGSDYSVAVQARSGGVVMGFGCADAVSVMAGRQTEVNVTIRDVGGAPVRIEGSYDLENRVDFGGVLPPTVETIVDVLAELTDDEDIDGDIAMEEFGQDPGAFVVDFAMRQTCHWECMMGEDFATCSETNHPYGDIRAVYLEDFMSWPSAQRRFFGGCGAWETAHVPAQNLVNDQVAMIVPAFITNFAVIAGDLSRAVNDARIDSILTVQPPTEVGSPIRHELVTMHVTLHDLSGTESAYMFDLADVGFMALRTDATAEIVGDTIEIPAHSFNLDYGDLLQYVYVHGVLPLLGFTSTEEMLASWIDCSMVGASLAMSVGVLSESAYTDACTSGLRAAGVFIDTGLGDLIDAEGTLTLQGAARGTDLDGMGIAQTLSEGMWTGSWGEGGMSGTVTGTFTGTRR